MWRGWLLLPILLPVLGGIGVLGIQTLRVRRRTVSLLLAVQCSAWKGSPLCSSP